MDEASATVTRERLDGFGLLRVRLRRGSPALIAFEVLRGDAAVVVEENGDDPAGDAVAGDDGPAWTLLVPWAARAEAWQLLADAAARLGGGGGGGDAGEGPALDEPGVTVLARASLGLNRELLAVALSQADERVFAVWRRERPAEGEAWRWTADVVVVPGDLGGTLLGAMLGALERLAEAEAEAEVAAAAARARSGLPAPRPSPTATRRPALLPVRHAPRAADGSWPRRRRGFGGPGQLLRRAVGHLLSFEAAFVLFIYSNELKTVVALPLPLDETVLFGALAVGIGGLVVLREGVYLRGLPVVAAALLFIAWATMSAGWSPSRVLVKRDAAYLLTFTLLSVVAGGLIVANRRERAERFFALALAVAFGMALYGLYIHAAYGDFRRWAGWRDVAGRVYLAFGHTVVNGAGIAFATALFARFGSARQAWAGLVFGVCAAFLLVGGGRGPFLGVVLAALVGLATRPPTIVGRERHLAVPYATAAATLMLALAAGYVAYLFASGGTTTTLSRFAKLLTEAENPSLLREGNRFAYWSAAYRYWLQAPLVGHGLSSFSGMFLLGLEIPGTHPHNIVLQTLSELGIVGLVLLGAFLWLAVRNASFRRLRRDPLMVCALLFVVTSAMSALFGRDIVGVRKFFFAVSLLALRPPALVRRPAGWRQARAIAPPEVAPPPRAAAPALPAPATPTPSPAPLMLPAPA